VVITLTVSYVFQVCRINIINMWFCNWKRPSTFSYS